MRPVFKAALWMALAIAGFSAMALAGRAVSPPLDSFEIMIWRSLIGLAIMLGVIAARRDRAALAPTHLGLHLLRNTVHFAGQNLWLTALTLIPLAQLFALEFSYPVIVALAAPLVLGERFTATRLVSALIGFLGILIVAQPWGAPITPGLMLALASALGFAGSSLVTKLLTRRTSVTAILFWVCAMQLVMSLVMAGWDGTITAPTAAMALPLLIIGVAGLGAHLALTQALRLAPASVVVPMDFLRLPIIGVIGAVWYGEPLQLATFLGASVIFFAVWLNVRADSRVR